MLNIKQFHCNPFSENCYLLWSDEGTGVVVDPGFYNEEELDVLWEYIKTEGVKLEQIWLTHGHFDHIFGVAAIARKMNIPVLMSPNDKPSVQHSDVMAASFDLTAPDIDFEPKDIFEDDKLYVGKHEFVVIETPGHTPGCLCFYDEADKVLFSGDTLFAGSIGRTDHPGGDYDKEIVSVMDKIMGLPGDVDVLPGHGGKTSIADERTNNPFLQPFNEPEENEDWDAEGIEIH